MNVGAKDHKFGKWSPSWDWEGQYKIVKVNTENSYMVEKLQGECLLTTLNGTYLNIYYVWWDA
jgi:hypothetical protein